MIYLITTEDKSICKIGFSKNPEKRLKEIQTGCPQKLHIEEITEGTFKTEKLLHSKFKQLRVQGEWFTYDDSISLTIEEKDLKQNKKINYEKYIENQNLIIKQNWNYLHERLTPLEFKVAHFLSQKAAPVTNSLAPFNDDTKVRDLSEEFGISVGKVKAIFDKLFKEGVYAKFELYQRGHEFTRYWILNPYLSFNGKEIHLKTLELFKNTDIAFAFHSK